MDIKLHKRYVIACGVQTISLIAHDSNLFQICQALSTLCEDPNNTVFVVSGDSQENVEEAIGHIPRLGLAASNGACFAPPLKPGETARSWKFFDKGVDWDAVKKVCLPVKS